ncbi:MAG: CpsD/CapB family tyrosine-protein kinase [Candidatus Krumholzibacteria bacterium]|nr:CpsD/CapB family tyrosine-protein kinase [Candidatus Krumholzibacteria bacterium]
MSKIYDALRKAEGDKLRPRRGAKRNAVSKTRMIKKRHMFLKGVDEKFRLAIMQLRNSIDSEMKQKESRVVMFTSAVKGEGKTTIAVSLAKVLAIGESERILLVDCSMINPELHKLFRLKKNKGILDYLTGEAELREIVQTIESGALDIITTGSSKGIDIAQPFFNSDRMDHFVKEVAEVYDYVFFDTSAILESPETPIIGSYMDGVVMVIYTGKTRREVVKRAILTVEKLDGRFIGTVLNRKKYYIPDFIYRRV